VGGDSGLTYSSGALNIESNNPVLRFSRIGSVIGEARIRSFGGVFVFESLISSVWTERFRFDILGRLGVNTDSITNTLDVNGTARIRTISNLGSTATRFLVASATGVISERTGAELVSDIGAVQYTSQTLTTSQKNQARVNIGSTSATPQVIATSGAINDLVVTSNSLVFTGASVVLSGIVAGLDGEEITILNTNATVLSILNQSLLSSTDNRIIGAVLIPQWSIVRLKYRTTTNKWIIDNVGINDGRYLRKDVNDTKEGRLLITSSGINRAAFLPASGNLIEFYSSNPAVTTFIHRGTSQDNYGNPIFEFLSNTGNLNTSTIIRATSNTGDVLFGLLASGRARILRSLDFTAQNAYVQFIAGGNLITDTTTGTKIGTATTQKLAFWNATPIVQPTTGVGASTLVSNAGTTLTSTDTFDGYTLQQIVKALRNTGLLA
jgi:hypothetical protein